MANTEYVALGDIQHGTAKGFITLQAGDPVPTSVDDDAVDQLLAVGAIAHKDSFGIDPVDAEREAELDQRQQDLDEREKQLEEARAAVEKQKAELAAAKAGKAS